MQQRFCALAAEPSVVRTVWEKSADNIIVKIKYRDTGILAYFKVSKLIGI